MTKGYLGIDNGTQGLSVIFTDENLKVLATGESTYGFVVESEDGLLLQEGCYEQRPDDWDKALQIAMERLHHQMHQKGDEIERVLAIGISGQMHGEVLVDETGTAISSARLWCDARNETEGNELTRALGCKIPKRATCARFLWTARNRPDRAIRTRHITTPAGWIAYRLTGQFHLGIGDASGMFPIHDATLDYDEEKLAQFDAIVNNPDIPSLRSILPKVCKAGEDAGSLTRSGAELLGLSSALVENENVMVAAAEGDQVAALAGSLIGRAGVVSCCFGTSVCANAVGDRAFLGVSSAVDHFRAADGKPINMVWLRNGTTFLNTIVQSYASIDSKDDDSDTIGSNAFGKVMPKMIAAPPDCGGLLALPFMDDEPGLGVSHGSGSAMIVGWKAENSTVGNIAKIALLSTMFNLRLGCQVLDSQGFPRSEIVLSGGLTKTPECGQILADVFDSPVTLLPAADEGCSWGAAIMAKYRHICALDSTNIPSCSDGWANFLETVKATSEEGSQLFTPDPGAVAIYKNMFTKYQKLIQLQKQISEAIALP
jgi:sugar (pentulose or hexulose) kinase